MANIYRLEAKIPWRTTVDLGSGAWIGVCEPLRVTALGETVEDLHQAIFETMDALFRDLLAEGELDSFLRAHGWTFQGNPSLEQIDDESHFDIPIEVIAAASKAHAQA